MILNAEEQSAEAASTETRSKEQASVGNPYPFWAPRFWHGMTFYDYFRLLKTGRFRVSPARFHLAIITLIVSVINSILAWFQFLFFDRQIRKAKLPERPVFVIGHFRTGTTMILEYLACDKQFVYPTTYQCFSPRHFLLTEKLFTRLISFLLPKRRPMDNMPAGFERPQEDEFGLLSLAAPTIYQQLAFPNEDTPYTETLTFDQETSLLKRWRKQILWFYRAITIKNPSKNLLIKSPVHTGRIAQLLRLFPDAKFVHIVRNPQNVFPSIKNAWRILNLTQGFQVPNGKHADAFIFDTLNEMYRGFWEQSVLLKSDQLFEVRYEDFLVDPVENLKEMYEQLGLGDFNAIEPALKERVASLKEYQENCFQIDASIQETVADKWSRYAERYGYD